MFLHHYGFSNFLGFLPQIDPTKWTDRSVSVVSVTSHIDPSLYNFPYEIGHFDDFFPKLSSKIPTNQITNPTFKIEVFGKSDPTRLPI